MKGINPKGEGKQAEMNELTIPEQQQLQTHEAIIERGLNTFVEVGNALMAIRDGRLYRSCYGTFEDYCRERWGMVRRQADRLIEAAQVVENLRPIGLIPANEAQARHLAQLPPDQQATVWQQVVETAPNGKITARHVESVVTTILGDEPVLEQVGPSSWLRTGDAVPAEDNRPLYADDPGLDEALAEAPAGQEVDEKPYNYKRDNRRSVASDIYAPQGMDACQTPAYALDPLLPYLRPEWVIWEPAAGEGLLVEALYDAGYRQEMVINSDLLAGQNFFDYEPEAWDCLVTNPPYSIQFQWLERCYQLGKPFALLLKVEILGTKTAQEMMERYGFEILLLDKRVDFKMPRLGWGDDDHKSSAQFPTFWFCWNILPRQVMFGKLNKEARGNG